MGPLVKVVVKEGRKKRGGKEEEKGKLLRGFSALNWKLVPGRATGAGGRGPVLIWWGKVRLPGPGKERHSCPSSGRIMRARSRELRGRPNCGLGLGCKRDNPNAAPVPVRENDRLSG